MSRGAGGTRRAPVLLAAGLIAAASPLAAQQTIEGRVLNASSGEPLEDVSVRVVGEGLLVGTDSAGVFRFDLPEGRPGFALEVQVIGFAPIHRTWMLPLERELVIALEREAVQLEGIDVEVDRGRMTLNEALDRRVRSIERGIARTARAADLRAFPGQNAEVFAFFPWMTIGTNAGCDGCLMSNGRVRPNVWTIDDRVVAREEFEMMSVGDMCRIDVVTIPRLGHGVDRGMVFGYTCDFLMKAATGEIQVPLLNMWR